MNQIEKDILKWYNKDIYSRLGSDLSVTEMLKPLRIIHLENRYRPKIVKTDINQLLPAMIGNGLHEQLQRYLKLEGKVNDTWKVERKLTSVINGVRLTGRFDLLYNDTDLYDIKVTSAYKAKKGDYSDWEKQLNIYDWMLSQDGISVATINVCMVVLDWKKADSYQAMYPNTRLSIIPLKKWSRKDQEMFISNFVNSMIGSKNLSDEELPFCSEQDRWADEAQYKLFRLPEHQKAVKVFPNMERAKKYLAACEKRANNKTDWDKAVIKQVVANPWRRCENYCDVSNWCNQYKNKLGV